MAHSLDVLPDALLERILVLLPFANVFRIAAVCKRWNSIVTPKAFVHLCEQRIASRPWFFLYKPIGIYEGCAYDPLDERWLHCREFSGIYEGLRPIASANGLICFQDILDRRSIIVCNPMTNFLQKLAEPSTNLKLYPTDLKLYTYSVSMAANKDSTSPPTIILAQFDRVDSQDFYLSIKEYDFSLQIWGTKAVTRVHCNGNDDPHSAICKGFFYCVVMSAAQRHSLITYELSSGVLTVASIARPCSLTCVGLMNCNDKPIIVGEDGDLQQFTGVGIWELVDNEWREIARMPEVHSKTLQKSPFYCSGMGNFIYIHAFKSRHLFLYSITERSWVRTRRCPMAEEDASNPCAGICFEPRLKVSA